MSMLLDEIPSSVADSLPAKTAIDCPSPSPRPAKRQLVGIVADAALRSRILDRARELGAQPSVTGRCLSCGGQERPVYDAMASQVFIEILCDEKTAKQLLDYVSSGSPAMSSCAGWVIDLPLVEEPSLSDHEQEPNPPSALVFPAAAGPPPELPCDSWNGLLTVGTGLALLALGTALAIAADSGIRFLLDRLWPLGG